MKSKHVYYHYFPDASLPIGLPVVPGMEFQNDNSYTIMNVMKLNSNNNQ